MRRIVVCAILGITMVVTLVSAWSVSRSKSQDIHKINLSNSEATKTLVVDGKAEVEILTQLTHDYAIRVTLRSTEDVLLIDESGRRTGYIDAQEVKEVPNTEYEAHSEDRIVRVIQSLVKSKATGIYTLKVIGTGDGQYTMGILLTRDSDVALYREVTATTSPGRIDTYKIDTELEEVSLNKLSYITVNTEKRSAGGENITCVESDKYVAVVMQRDWSQLPKAYVYKKSTLTGETVCRVHESVPVFTMDLEATYLKYLIGDFLITDTGTGPSGRVLSAYNLNTQKIVFSERYGNTVMLHPPDSIGYWRPTGATPSMVNCPNRDEIENNYLTPEVQEYVRRNLLKEAIERKEQRCVATQ